MPDDPKPGFTMVSNAILDHIADLSEAELRIMLVIARKTAGWQKECDLISLTQFETMTGLSRPSVNETLKRLVERGAVEHTGTGKRGVKCYRLSDGLVNSVNQLSRATSKLSSLELVNSVNQTSPGLVNSVNTQKKDLNKEKERGSAQARNPPPATLDFLHEGVTIWKRLTGKKNLPPIVATAIAEKVTDTAAWEKCVSGWLRAGYNANNVTGMLDWYEHPEKIARPSANGHTPAEQRPALEPFKPKVRTQLSPAEMKAALEKARSS